jgi:hypothetical protein
MEIESTRSSAVPVRVTGQEVRPGVAAFAVAVQFTWPLVVNAPWAVPDSWRPPAQDALKAPRALVPVCSLAFHLKSVHELGAGIRFDAVRLDDQLPISALLPPAAAGPVSELSRSKPMHPVAENAARDNTATRIRFFMIYISVRQRADFARGNSQGGEKYTSQRPCRVFAAATAEFGRVRRQKGIGGPHKAWPVAPDR